MTKAVSKGATDINVNSLLVEMDDAEALGRKTRLSRTPNPRRSERPMLRSMSFDSSNLLRRESLDTVLLEEAFNAIEHLIQNVKVGQIDKANVTFAEPR